MLFALYCGFSHNFCKKFVDVISYVLINLQKVVDHIKNSFCLENKRSRSKRKKANLYFMFNVTGLICSQGRCKTFSTL